MVLQRADLSTLQRLDSLSPASKSGIERLLRHDPDDDVIKTSSYYPSAKCAAVLVLLYEKDGALRVLLTTRSRSLRTHPFQTACPGGKVEAGDNDRLATALREANEEVGLPQDRTGLHFLCYLRTFVSVHKILVTPAVVLLTDLSLLEQLKPSADEVEHIFDHRLDAILDPSVLSNESLAEKGSELWPYEEEHYSTADYPDTPLGPYRMHRFRSVNTPIKGLTADILITVAEIAFKRSPVYQRHAPNQLDPLFAISQLLGTKANGEATNNGPPA